MPPVPRTELGLELYELMKEPSGTTSAAIRDKPHLMGLQYVRAEAPTLDDDEAREDAVAVTVREFIEEATGALDKETSQREHTAADNGAAARYLLALEQGTASMPLHERRERAFGYLHLKNAASLRHQHKNKKRGVTETRETRLMDTVADKLIERETDFLKDSRLQDPDPSVPPGSPLLAVVSELWRVSQNLHTTIGDCVGILRPQPGDEYPHDGDYDSLFLLGRFWQLVRIPSKNDPFLQRDRLASELFPLWPEGSVAILWVLTPFEQAVIEEIRRTDLLTPGYGWPQFVHDLMPQWHEWLSSCTCDTAPNPDCLVHKFQNALDGYIKHLDQCWRDLRDPYHSPDNYRSHRTPDETLRYYALNTNLDNYTRIV
jgi:hypothetical protein